MKINQVLVKLDQGYTVRTEQFQDRAHIVAPVVILTEGVHCGSAGCKYYPPEELEALPPAWNGRPLPVFHPEDAEGNALSANTPELIEKQSVGQLFNIEFVDGALKGELYIDIQKAQKISPETLATIQARRPLEVSTGLWSTDELISGEWNGEAYDSIVRGIVPDHLALLPGGLGACSVDDGCGVRVNSAGVYTTNPFPNEHAARLKSPGQYTRFRRENNKFGSGIHAIWGIKSRGDEEVVELQAIRFAKSRFTAPQARKWLRDHNHSVILFEPASGGQSNQEEKKMENLTRVETNEYPDKSQPYSTKFIVEGYSGLSKKVIENIEQFIDNELSHGDVRMSLQQEVDKLDNSIKVHYVMEVYDNYFIYRMESRREGEPSKLYKQSYSVKDNNEVELGEEVDEVKQVVRFEKLNAKEVDVMADKVKKCCPEKVQALIDNKDNAWTEDDKEMLLNMSSEQFERIELVINKEEEKDDDAKKTIEALEAENKKLKANAEKTPKFEDVLANAPEDVKESVEYGQTMYAQQKASLIDQIKANDNCDYTEDELKGMKFPALIKLAKAFRANTDYSLNLRPDATAPSDNTEEPLTINRGDNGKKKEAAK